MDGLVPFFVGWVLEAHIILLGAVGSLSNI